MFQRQPRYIELDLLRTVAVFTMVAYHVVFDLWYYYGWSVPTQQVDWSLRLGGGWYEAGRLTAILFLLLTGASFVITWKRCAGQYRFIILRALKILSLGGIITIVTYLTEPSTTIWFGILHCIGVAQLLLLVLLPLRTWNALVGIVVILAGRVLQQVTLPIVWLLPLGIKFPNFQTLDYYPLLPWAGFVFIGAALGEYFYLSGRRKAGAVPLWLHCFTWPGRHSLLIYCAHQPMILFLLYLLIDWG